LKAALNGATSHLFGNWIGLQGKVDPQSTECTAGISHLLSIL